MSVMKEELTDDDPPCTDISFDPLNLVEIVLNKERIEDDDLLPIKEENEDYGTSLVAEDDPLTEQGEI